MPHPTWSALLVLAAACGSSSPSPGTSDAADTVDGSGSADAAPPADASPPVDAPCTTCTPLMTSWEHHYGGDDFGYYVEAIWVDGAGNTYVTGMFENQIDLGGGPLTSAGDVDIVVASFAPNGTYRWAKRFGGAMGDQGAGITVAGGKVYVAGTFTGDVDFGGGTLTGSGRGDALILVLDAATGDYDAALHFGTSNDDATLGIVVDAAGNITVAGDFSTGTLDFGGGHTITGAATDNAFVASFKPDGTHRWSRTLAGSAAVAPATGSFDAGQAIAIDSAGNVTVVGGWMGTTDFGAGMVTSTNAANYEFDAFVASYTAMGVPRWSRSYGVGLGDMASGAAVDTSGNVVVGGSFHGTVSYGGTQLTQQGIADGFALLLDGASGATKLARSIGDPNASGIQSVRADSQGNLVVMGSMEAASTDLGNGVVLASSGGEDDMFVAGFASTDGKALFGKRWGGAGSGTYLSGAGLSLSVHDSMAIGGTFSGPVDLGMGAITAGSRNAGFAMLVTR